MAMVAANSRTTCAMSALLNAHELACAYGSNTAPVAAIARTGGARHGSSDHFWGFAGAPPPSGPRAACAITPQALLCPVPRTNGGHETRRKKRVQDAFEMVPRRHQRASAARNAAAGATVMLLLGCVAALPTPKIPARLRPGAARGPGAANMRLGGGSSSTLAASADTNKSGCVPHVIRRWASPVGLLVSLGCIFPQLVIDFRACWCVKRTGSNRCRPRARARNAERAACTNDMLVDCPACIFPRVRKDADSGGGRARARACRYRLLAGGFFVSIALVSLAVPQCVRMSGGVLPAATTQHIAGILANALPTQTTFKMVQYFWLRSMKLALDRVSPKSKTLNTIISYGMTATIMQCAAYNNVCWHTYNYHDREKIIFQKHDRNRDGSVTMQELR